MTKYRIVKFHKSDAYFGDKTLHLIGMVGTFEKFGEFHRGYWAGDFDADDNSPVSSWTFHAVKLEEVT
jgi:hypothetical protein